MKFCDEEKQELVDRYHSGESASDIRLQTGVPRSTFYTWLKPYRTVISQPGYTVSADKFVKIRQ